MGKRKEREPEVGKSSRSPFPTVHVKISVQACTGCGNTKKIQTILVGIRIQRQINVTKHMKVSSIKGGGKEKRSGTGPVRNSSPKQIDPRHASYFSFAFIFFSSTFPTFLNTRDLTGRYVNTYICVYENMRRRRSVVLALKRKYNTKGKKKERWGGGAGGGSYVAQNHFLFFFCRRNPVWCYQIMKEINRQTTNH
ncbi:hypothetical protein, unlikely [Trypanosoma brucei gambiense DAL972]|uniref:Uncharacterized protein n=1 Tax=Trypanosoma brucei gambiense (strain MHOM/CI/86/DAL972) TaxID=679716 RepID=C9ZLI9_TRYB9|nr:hypothetical protein, unlikely [Trypanosoma brucei gambiense DAL972]CBH10198.1 hypothetical protein, unlikely [Trypanosoma brucei gambiense DAL972]|eukprot:XP_011772488.1 hypothetical protein, unlikely [Trypanosoma brucei gambiense DAL972]